MTSPPPPPMSHYALLRLPPPPAPFSAAALKRAYHRALLRYHPDKTQPSSEDPAVSVDAITTAYKTLLSPALRDEYNRSLLTAARSGEESSVASVMVHWDLDEMEEVEPDGGVWAKRCRCGEMVNIHEDTLEEGGEAGEAWVVCEGCSIVYCVGFEVMGS